MVVKLRSRLKRWLLIGGPIFRVRGIPEISDMHFKSQSLPSMWPVLVEFRSELQRVRRVADEKIHRRRIAVKPKSVDNYIGRPN